jgi:hypothetical protein
MCYALHTVWLLTMQALSEIQKKIYHFITLNMSERVSTPTSVTSSQTLRDDTGQTYENN